MAQPFYLGNNEVTSAYLGNTALTEAYLGEVLVYQAGEFAGIKLSPRTVEFDSFNSTATIKVKASEAWTMTLPSWLSADTLTGSSGETIVTLTSSAAAQTGGTITVSSANYSGTAEAEYVVYEQLYSIYSAVRNTLVNLGLQSSDSLKFIWEGQVINNTGEVLIGSSAAPDNADWRWFQVASSINYFDIGSSRISKFGTFPLNEDKTVECGNLYIKYDGSVITSGVTVTTVPTLDMYCSNSCLYTRHLMFEENGAFAAYLTPVRKGLSNSYGFYDSIRKRFIETPNCNYVAMPSYDLMDAQLARYLGDVYYWVDLGVDISATAEEPVFEDGTTAADGFATRQQNGTTWMFLGNSYFGKWECTDIGITIQPIYFPDVLQPNSKPLTGLLVTDGQAGTDRFVPVTGLISWDALQD